MAKAARGLGRGLDSLFQIEQIQINATQGEEYISEIPINLLRPNPYQPRKDFNKDALEELKQSILENGIFQPLIVRKSSLKGYEIIAGERRFRAAKLAKLECVPAVVREFDDAQMIMNKLGYTQEVIADRMGKSRSHVANFLRLLTVPPSIKSMIANDQLSFGHAKVLMGIKNEQEMIKFAEISVSEQLSVRKLEELITNQPINSIKRKKKSSLTSFQSQFIQAQSETLREKFGTKVKIHTNKSNEKGKIEINFLSIDDLERLLEILTQN